MHDRPVPRLRLLRGRGDLTRSKTDPAAPLEYDAAVAGLRSRGRFGISLGLARIEALLDELGNPQRGLRGALVGGTNGKGSVVALARSVLQVAGFRVGTMPKPHLVSYRERIAIDGIPISRERFAAALASVMPAIDAVSNRLGPPTEFEALTAAAFVELTRAGVDVALVEIGLGGRLDATNVLDAGVAAITNVQHDHERLLGPTLAAIGAEKAAIIKRGNLAVTGARGRGLVPILERCAAVGAPLRRSGARQPYQVQVRDSSWDGLLIDATTPAWQMHGVRVGLLGSHQAANAGVALALLDALIEDAARRGAELRVDEAAIRQGLAAAQWSGRLELLADTTFGRILLDGAHNPAGARALARALGELGMRRFPMVFGATRGKRVSAVLRALAPLEPRPIFTRVQEGSAMAPADLLRRWRRFTDQPAHVASTPDEALRLATSLRRTPEQPMLVAGSLYLVGAVRGMLRGEEEDAR
ncbi:MAG: Mur ligase family protein [Chloroflexota bacterium]|nr:Mur ligase family protein [Chloroflexota bacterium]